MLRITAFVASVGLSGIWDNLAAENVDWLYQVEIPVASRTESIANEALTEALEVMLIRTTGLSSVPLSNVVLDALRTPSSYIVQYYFSTITTPSEDDTDVLIVQFNRNYIQDLLRRAQLPIWSSNRPRVLLWMVAHEQGGSQLLQSGTTDVLGALERAKERGLSLVLPLMDLHDQSFLTQSSIDGRFWDDLREASRRYSADFIAAVASERNIFGEMRITATYWFKNQEHSFVVQNSGVNQAGRVVVDLIADRLAEQLAIQRLGQETVRVRVSRVSTISTYARLLEFLGQLEFIDRFEVVGYKNNALDLDIYTPSTSQQFKSLIATTSVLETDGSLISEEGEIQLYLWVDR